MDTAVRARFEAADNYETSVTLDWLNQPGALLATHMNGAPLPPKHGYPLRLFMPGLYGQKCPNGSPASSLSLTRTTWARGKNRAGPTSRP